MPNTGIGRWQSPDIRPEEIDAFTEIATVDGEEQTEEQKAINMHPTLNGVLDKKGWFRTHAGAVWYNAKQKITVLQKIDNIVANIGTLTALLTTDKSSLVVAMNEVIGNSHIFTEHINSYHVGSDIAFTPISQKGYLAIVYTRYGDINSLAYKTQYVTIPPGKNSFKLTLLVKYDGSYVTSGVADISVIYIPQGI